MPGRLLRQPNDISKRINAIQDTSLESVEAIGKISQVIQNVNELSKSIAAAVEEQSSTAREISQNVTLTAQASETVAQGVNETAAAGQEITRNIADVSQIANHTSQGATQTLAAAEESLQTRRNTKCPGRKIQGLTADL